MGMVAALVSWTGRRRRWVAPVTADTTNTRAPSQRAATRPFNAFNRPGPVVVKTRTGLPVAREASAAENAAPASWRVCTTRRPLLPRASAKVAQAPPMRPKACSIPSRWANETIRSATLSPPSREAWGNTASSSLAAIEPFHPAGETLTSRSVGVHPDISDADPDGQFIADERLVRCGVTQGPGGGPHLKVGKPWAVWA